VRTIVLVEGATDKPALTLAAGRLDRDLATEGVSVVVLACVHSIGRLLPRLLADEPGVVSSRNSRYVRTILEAIDPAAVPQPIRLMLDCVELQ